MGESCVKHGEIEVRVERAEKDIVDLQDETKDISGRVVKLEKHTALDSQKFTQILESLSGLPDAIKDIHESLLIMNKEIKDSGNQIKELKEHVERIDDEGKFNIRLWVKRNFIPIATFATGTGMIISSLF